MTLPWAPPWPGSLGGGGEGHWWSLCMCCVADWRGRERRAEGSVCQPRQHRGRLPEGEGRSRRAPVNAGCGLRLLVLLRWPPTGLGGRGLAGGGAGGGGRCLRTPPHARSLRSAPVCPSGRRTLFASMSIRCALVSHCISLASGREARTRVSVGADTPSSAAVSVPTSPRARRSLGMHSRQEGHEPTPQAEVSGSKDARGPRSHRALQGTRTPHACTPSAVRPGGPAARPGLALC